MLTLRKPSMDMINRFIATQEKLPLSYEDVGATATSPPAGFVVDHTRVTLGRGEETYLNACEALTSWEHFRLSWVRVTPPHASLAVGQVVVVTIYRVGFWWLNACRIVEVVHEDEVVHKDLANEQRNSLCRYGFAYGTLPGHAERGEERFLVEWNRETDEVHYDILAFSKPRHWLAKLGYPMVRRLQKRFGYDSANAIVQAVSPASYKPEICQQTG